MPVGTIAAARRRSSAVGGAYRYFKWTVTGTISFNEVGAEELILATSSGGANVAQGKSVTVTSQDTGFGHIGSNAVDGVNPGTRWLTGVLGFPHSITVDLGAGNAVTPVEFRHSPPAWSTVGDSRGWTAVSLYGSNDWSSFTLLQSWTTGTYSGSPLSRTFAISSTPPTFSVGPTITTDTGFYAEGDTATVSFTHNGSSTTYQWTRNGSPISGATSASYTYVSGDVGAAVGCTVTAINGWGNTAQASTATTIGTPTYATHSRVPAGDMNSGSDSRLTAGDMQSGTDTRITTERTA